MALSLHAVPFLLHILIETPAALTFILRPASQLSPLPPGAVLILQSLGGLLLASNLIAIVFIQRPFDDVARHVAAALAFWHLWPCYRAFIRLQNLADDNAANGIQRERKEDTATTKTLGGPAIHLIVHSTLFVMFLSTLLLGDIEGSSITSIP